MAFSLRKMLGIGPKPPPEPEEATTKKRRNDSDTQPPEPSKEKEPSGPSQSIPVGTVKPRLSPKPKKQRLDSPKDSPYANVMVEHTPKKITLGIDYMDEHNSEFKLDNSSVSDIEFSDIDSLSELETTLEKDKIPLCRKLSKEEMEAIVPDKIDLEAEFADLEEFDRDKKLALLESYQNKLDRIEKSLKSVLTEFQFHIEVSGLFKDDYAIWKDKELQTLKKYMDPHVVSSTGAWNVIEKEKQNKKRFRKQLLAMKDTIDKFTESCLINKKLMTDLNSTMNDDSTEDEKKFGKFKVNKRKRELKLYDFPDLKETLQNLFSLDADPSITTSISANNVTLLLSDVGENKCICRCPEHHRVDSLKSTDSGLPAKQDGKSDSISSSIGDFSLDNSQLTAYSESLEQILSYHSFNDSSIVMMNKISAIERITFYVKVHNIEMKGGNKIKERRRVPSISDLEYDFLHDVQNQEIYVINEDECIEECEENNAQSIIFKCKPCEFYTTDEKGLYKHILEPHHCENLHFMYKIAYIRKCFSTGEEIQPSTILNPMTMYRDDNKIVCFGDSKYACSLCFQRKIVGEFVLMTHCNSTEHVEKKNWMTEFLGDAKNNDADDKIVE